jgi:hypothetical protein
MTHWRNSQIAANWELSLVVRALATAAPMITHIDNVQIKGDDHESQANGSLRCSNSNT